MSSPKTSATRIHSAVHEASRVVWNNEFDLAESLLGSEKTTNPRHALEYANGLLVQSLMNTTNEKRERLLELYKVADGLASSKKNGTPMISDSSEEEDRAIAIAALTDVDPATLSPEEKVKLAQLKEQKSDASPKTAGSSLKNSSKSMDELWKMECDVIYADALLLRAVIQLQQNSYLRGGVNLRKAWGCYYALIIKVEKDPSIPQELQMNIKYGCGVFYIYLALVPAGLMKLLSAIGFISDMERGEEYVTEVINSNTIRSCHAALGLLTYYLFMPTGLGNVNDTLAKAKVILDKMNSEFPNNTYFWGYTNFYHRKRGETPEAMDAITRAASNAEKAGQLPLLLRYLHADTLYMDLQWEAAKVKYQEVLDTIEAGGEKFAYTGQVVLSLAACYVMLGDDATALTWLKRVNSMYNPKSKQDANSPKFANKCVSEPRLLPLLGVYVLYINRDLAHMKAGHCGKLQAELDRVVRDRDLSPTEVTGMHRLFVGVMHKSQSRTADATASFESIIDHEKKFPSDSIVLPFTYYEYAELEYRGGNLQRSKQLFEKGSSLKNDNETLANRYTVAMKQLRKDLAKA